MTSEKTVVEHTGRPAARTGAKSSPRKVAGKQAASPASKKEASSSEVRKSPVKRAARSKSPADSADNYTKPELREAIKKKVIAGDKGGRAGQWSARKAQLVAHEYEAEGGGYKHSRNAAQTSLKQWGDEHWHTADGEQAIQGDETHRYLPDEAWKKLSPEERKATDRKKVAASKTGRQFVANTPAAAKARKNATEHPTKS